MTNTEWLRSRLLQDVFITDQALRDKAERRTAKLFADEHIRFILKEMQARIMMGTYRYEGSGDPRPWSQRVRAGDAESFLSKLAKKVALYQRTKNQEFLVDAMNYLNLEFVEPCEEGVFYKSTERAE